MPTPAKPWWNSGLQFCGSCLLTLACWVLWIALSVSLVTLAYVAVAKEMPVPGFVLRRAEAELAKAGLVIKFGRAHFDPSGKILLEDVELRSQLYEEPLLTCQWLYVRHDFWSVLAGRPIPDEIRLEGAGLQLPAILSPSGATEPLARDLAVVLRHRDHRWLGDRCSGRLGPLNFTAQGELAETALPKGRAALTPGEIINRYLQLSRRFVVELQRLSAVDNPTLSVRLENAPVAGHTAHLFITARGATEPWAVPLVLGPFAVSASLPLDHLGERPVHLHAVIRRVAYRNLYAAENLHAMLAFAIRPEQMSLHPLEAQVTIGAVTAEGETIVGPIVRAGLAQWPAVTAAVGLHVDGEFLDTEADVHMDTGTARIRAEGRVAPGPINRALTAHTPRAAPFFVFGDPLAVRAEAELGPGWKFARLSSRVAAGRLDSRGVLIDAARGRVDIVGTSFLAHDATVTMGDNAARGSYWMDFATSNYRMLLEGRLRPPAINGWFRGGWWLGFWNRYFAFNGPPPEAEVDVQGCWRDGTQTIFFGRADARSARVWGGDFETAHAIVYLRPNFTHAYDLDATRAGGREHVRGWIKRFGDTGARDTRRLEFDFTTSADPVALGRMLDGKADEVLATLRFSRPPLIHAAGAIDSPGPEAQPDYVFTGEVDGGFHYLDFPLESARVSGRVNGTTVRLDEIAFKAAGGQGAGKASVSGAAGARRLGFDLFLNQADLARTIRAFEEYQAARTGQKSTSVTESKFMKRASGGRLDVAVSAEGTVGAIASFTGSGNAALTGTELAEVHLFGLLSQVLSTFSLTFSSLKLNEVHTSFRLEGGRLNFPDLKVMGPSAVIDARGNYSFVTNALDFTAKFKPFEENRNPLTVLVDVITKPFTSILELKLTGPLSKPDWSIVMGGSGSHPETPPPAEPAPAPPNPPATEPAKTIPPVK